jgi:hypothetical protein
MARGDVKWFASALLELGQEVHTLQGDDIQLGIVTNLPVPTVNTPGPCWGAGGTTNLSSNQVALATGYTGPIALAAETWALAANVPNFSANSVVIPQDAAGFANGAYGIIFNNTATNKQCLGFIDLGGPIGNQNGPININFNSSAVSGPILRITPI